LADQPPDDGAGHVAAADECQGDVEGGHIEERCELKNKNLGIVPFPEALRRG
jgi:hypothetical protein